MGNEASMEGGEGALAGLPEGLAPDGKGGFIHISTGAQADLSHLSEEDRKRLAGAMSRVQTRPSGSQQPTRTPQGLSKSRTVDAFGEGPSSRPRPGRSPSSLSLFESRFRQEPKDSDQPRTSMFSTGFLSGANPLSAVSSAVSSASTNIPKFSLFGDEEEEQVKQGEKPPGPSGAPGPGKSPQQQGARPPQQVPPKAQGSPQQKGGPPTQNPGAKPGGPGPQQQGPKPGGPGPQQQGPKPGGPGPQQQGPKPGGPGPQQQGPKPGGPGPQQQGPKPGGPGPQQQGPKPGGPGPQQQGPKPGGPGPQQQGPKPGGPGPQQQGSKPQGPGPQQQGSGKPAPEVASKPGAQAPGPPKAGHPPGKAGGGLCPLCKTTELNTQIKDQPPNYSTCTQCKQQVCSLCGFSPPDSAGKEWLCLNCQMQRAMGGMEPPGPPMMKPPPKQGSAPPSPQKKEPPTAKASPKTEPGKKPPMLTKQQSIADTGKGVTPPATPKEKSPGPGPQGAPKGPPGSQPGPPGNRSGQPPPLQKPGPGGAPKIDPKTGRPVHEPGKTPSPKGSPVPSPAKTKQEGGFFGGFGFGGLTDMAKPPASSNQAADSVTSLFGGFGGSSKTQDAAPQESVTGKFFSGFGGLTETAKPTAAPTQTAEATSGKMFGFGSSILSSASNLIASTIEGETPASPPESPPGSPPDSPIDSGADSPPGSPPDSGSDSPPDTPPAYSKDESSQQPAADKTEEATSKPRAEPAKPEKSSCPLCKVDLNVGSGDAPNYSTCTECMKMVCNLCGFNPTPHISEKEWLCLNCQTQRALSGQLGDIPPPLSPSKLPEKHQPTPPSSPARALSSTPSSPAPTAITAPVKELARTPSVTQAPDEEPESDAAVAHDKTIANAVSAKNDETQPAAESTQVESDGTQIKDSMTQNDESVPNPPEKITEASTLPSDSIPEEKTHVGETEAERGTETVDQPSSPSAEQISETEQPEQSQLVGNDTISGETDPTQSESKDIEEASASAKEPAIMSKADEQVQICGEKSISLEPTSEIPSAMSASQEISSPDNVPSIPVDSELDKLSTEKCSEEVSSIQSVDSLYEKSVLSAAENQEQANTEQTSESAEAVGFVSTTAIPSTAALSKTIQEHPFELDQPATSEKQECASIQKVTEENANMVGPVETSNIPVPDVTNSRQEQTIGQGLPEQLDPVIPEDRPAVKLETETLSSIQSVADLAVSEHGSENRGDSQKAVDEQAQKDLEQANKIPDDKKIVEKDNVSVENEEKKQRTTDNKVEQEILSEGKGSSEESNQIPFASATANAPIPVPADATDGITTIPSQVGDNVHYVVGEREEPKKTDSAEIPEVKELSPQNSTFPIHTPETISSSSTEKTAENGKDGLLPDSLPHETISSVQTENKKEVHTSDHFSGDKKYEPPVSAQEIVSSECDLKGETFAHDKCKVLSVLEDSMEQPTGETKGTDDLTIKTETEIERELQKIGGKEQMHDRLPKSINSTTTVLDEKGIFVPDTKIDLKAPAPDVDKSLDQTKVENSNEKSDLPSTVTKQDASENKAESFPNEQILKCSAVLNTDLEEKQKRASPLETLPSQNTNVDLSPPFQNSNSPSCNESIPNENQDRAESSQTVKIENDSQSSSQPVEPVVEPVSLPVVISKQDKDERSREVASCPETQKKEEEVQSLIKPMQVDDLGEKKDDGAAPGKGMDKLPEPVQSNTTSQENTLTSPSDLAKLENTVLPIIEAQITSAIKDDSQDLSEQGKGRRRLEVLPMSPEVSSEEDGHGENKTVAVDAGSLKKERKKLSVPIELQVDLLGESSEGESSPSLQSKLNVTEDKDSHGDSVGSADEEYIRKEMIDMSADEDASPSIEVSPTQTKIRDQDSKAEQNVRKDSTERSEAGKSRRLLKNNSISPEDDPDNKNVMSMARSGEIGQKPSVESAAGVRHFKTIELNSTATARQMSDDGELESLTDSPDDKSRGEGSSSLHASSFTPGTSPTSLSSLDEDSDSSPSHNRSSGEGKQHRKAKHRQPGQMLPTIEDSSEEEELREEEELLREQEKQKGIGKKSKKDKEEIRAQRRRDHTKTPPSNLSPIEDASPTEELRQEAEMEEIRRSSCSDFSPSMDSEPEGFEILPDKITAVQKVYQLPTSVSLYSPTDDQHADNGSKGDKADWPLKTADEILKSTAETVEPPPGKESLYSGTLIEDYDYESRTEDTKKMEPGKISLPEKPKQLRSPDEVYEDMMKKKKEMMLEGQEVQQVQLVKEILKPEVILTPTDPNNAISAGITTQLNKDGKPLLDAEAAYEELMKRQRAVLTPGTSPTQTGPNIEDPSDGIQVVPTTNAESVPSRRVLPIPDLRVTQCSSGEEESGEESTVEQKQDSTNQTEPTPVVSTDKKSTAVVFDASDQVPDAALVSECVSESTVMKEVKTAQPQPSDLPEQSPDTTLSSSKDAAQSVEIDQPGVVDLSRFSTPSQISFSPTPVIDSMPSHTVLVSGSPLPTVPQYTATVPSVVSTACPISTKPAVLQRGVSQEKTDIPIPPPLPPPTLPKPSVYPKRIPPQIPPRPEQVSITNVVPNMSVRQPPPVPPKPSSIPAGLTFSHRPGESVKPPIAPKPLTQPPSPAHAPIRPTVLPTSSPDIALNLSPSTESKPTSPSKSPSSPRFGKSLHETYVVITLPSQPSSPVESVTTQAPSRSSPASPQRQMTPQSPSQPEQTPPPPPPPSQPHSPRVPLAFTRITESIESQEICGPEKVVSSMSHVYEAISASTQPPSTIPNVLAQVVTTEVQRTTVSVVHERAPPLPPTPRATGISVLPENLKTQPVQIQSEQVYTGEVVDLRTPKLDAEMPAKGVDLSSELRHQPPRADSIGRQTSAVQSSVINLSTDTTVSVVTDSITILTCTATIAYGSNGSSQSTSMPLQLTTAKSFEPLSQIIYRPVHSQPERPINLSMTTAKSNSPPVMTVPASVTTGMNTCQLDTGLSGAVDLTTAKPVQTMVSLDGSTSEVITAVISEDNGKPVDLTAGRRAVCCDVVYNLPFASSCTTQQPTVPLPEDRFGYRDDHYQYDRSPFGMRGLSGIKPSMSDTNLAEAGLFFYKSKNSYDYNSATDCAVDLTSGKISGAGEAVDYSSKAAGAYSGMAIPHSTQARITSAVGTLFGATSVLRSSNGVVYSSVAAPIPSTYAITTQPGSIFSTTYNTLSNMHASETMPSLSTLQNQPMTRSQSFLSTVAVTLAEESQEMPLNLEIVVSKDDISTALSEANANTRVAAQDSFTDASLDAIAASLEALSSPMVPGDGQYQMERELLELEKMKQQHLAEKLEWERQEIQRFREHEQLLVQKELEELQAMKQQILCQQEEERQAHLMMQKETYAQQQEQLEQIQRLQEQLRQQLEEQKFRQMFPSEIHEQSQPEALIVGGDKKIDSGVQTDEEDTTMDKAYTAGRKKKSAKKSVDSCVQTDDEDQDELVPSRGRRSRSRGGKYSTGDRAGVSIQALTEISVQTDSSGMLRGHSVQMDAKVEYPDSDGPSSPQRDKRRPTPLEIGDSPHLRADTSTLQVAPAPPKSPKVLYSPLSPCVSPSKSLDFMSYDKSLGDTSPQRIQSAVEPSKTLSAATRGPKVMQRSMSDPKPMSPTAEERAATNMQCPDGYTGKESPSGTPCGTQKKVKRTLPNPPSEEEVSSTGQIAYSTGSARRRLCRSTNMARAKILQDIDRELDLVERESSKLRKKQAELDEEEKEIDAKLRYLEMGINRRKDALLKEREKRERAYLQSVAEDRDYMSDSEVSNIREMSRGGREEEVAGHGLERPRTAPQSELDQFIPPQTKHDVQYGKYSQYQYPQQTLYQQSLYQSQQPYQSQSIYSSVPSLTASQEQSYHQMLLLQQKARQQATLLSELAATKMSPSYDVIRSQPDASSYLSGKYGNHLDLHGIEDRVGSIAGSPMSTVSADSFYSEVEAHHQTPRSYLLLEEAAELAKGPPGLSSTSYGLAEKELAKAERLLRQTAADVGSDYMSSTSRLHSYGKTQEEEDTMEEPYELKLLKQQLKQEFRRSTGGTESLEQLAGLPHHYYTPSTSLSNAAYRAYPKTEKYSISRLTLEKQAAKQLPSSVHYQKHKNTSNIGKYSSSLQESRTLETDYSSYLASSSSSPRSSRLLQDEITFGLRKNIAEQQKYLGSNLGANLAGSLNLGQSLHLGAGLRSSLGEDSVYPSGSRSRPSSRPSSVYGLDLSIKRDTSSSSLRLKAEGDPSSDTSAFQTPSGRTKPTSLPIGQGSRGRIPIVAQNSEEESPLSPVGQPMGMARASAGPLPPISADSRDQFGSCLSLQDPQQQHLRDDPNRVRSYAMVDDLQGTMSDSEALSDSLVVLNTDDPGNSHENFTNAYHLRREETDWFDKPRDGRSESGQGLDRRQMKSQHYPFPHTRVKLQRDPKDRSVSGNGLGIRVVGGKDVPGSNGEIGAYVAKVLPGGTAEQTGKILEGMQVLEWNSISLTGKTYEEVQGLVGQQCEEAELCVRCDLNMLIDSEGSHLDLHDLTKAGDRPPRSPGVDPKQLAAELQKVSQQQVPSSSLVVADKGPHALSGTASVASSTIPSPGQPGSPSVSKKRHSKTSETVKTPSHPITGEIQLQINYDKQLGNLIVHVLQARNLSIQDNNSYSDPFVKVYLLPGRGQVMVVQNASAESKRRSKHAPKSQNPEWNQTVIYKNIHLEQLRKKTLEVSVWDYDKSSSNDFLGEVLIDLSNTTQLDNAPRWLPLKEQSETDHHRRSHSGQSRQHSPKPPGQSSQHSPKTFSHGNQDSPKSSVIKSRSHGIFPDPGKDTQVPTIEKSHSSPVTSKPSPSEGQARAHGTPRAHGKSGAARAHLDDSGASIATAESAAQQHRLQPTQNGRLSLRRHRHSVVGVLTIQRPQSEPLANEIRDGRHLTLRKAMSEERPHPDGASRGLRSGDTPVTAASLDSGLSGSAYSLLEDEEGGTNVVDSAIFQVPKFGKIPNGTDMPMSSQGFGDTEGKTQMMGEIKIALKKEMKTEGEQLVLEILQCRNITYKFKSPDHLPDLYVKLYVVNVATQKRIIKKKTRVCRHDREPSFNETFRFSMNPTGHSLQLFLLSNGGKFVKKTVIGEAYVWLDKVDLRKRVVSWHKLLASTALVHS